MKMEAEEFSLENKVIECEWDVENGKIAGLEIEDVQAEKGVELPSGITPKIVLADGKIVDLCTLNPKSGPSLQETAAKPGSVKKEDRCAGKTITLSFADKGSGLSIMWSAELREDANYIIETIELQADRDIRIAELVFWDAEIEGAKQVGSVDGSVVVCGNLFMAVEHPLAKNSVSKGRVRCALPRGNVLKEGTTWKYSFVIGVTPARQLRRGFLYYLEQRRPHYYRPYLHYNSWYHLNIGSKNSHMTEKQCVDTVNYIGRELVEKRKVDLDAYVWDDGWDDFNSLWGFHSDFPDGFKNLHILGQKYNADQGVWMSPWGGYGGTKNRRIAYGKKAGYEVNKSGFSMSGPKYREAYRDVCLKMMREHGVKFFKFDGMGAGNSTGAAGGLADDVDSVLKLTQELRAEDPEVFISATVGTWASPFWVLYADSIWRQGGDTGFAGVGNGREQWITYRDKFAYSHVYRRGPLYPLNSLMLHGLCIGEHHIQKNMDRTVESVRNEIRSFFGSGTDLQELYISPHLLTDEMWDDLAEAATWARKNSDTLIDSHWIGGDPASLQVYGWASWKPGLGLITLRNPSDQPQAYSLDLVRDLQLPDDHFLDYELKAAFEKQRLDHIARPLVEPLELNLQPFEVLVFDVVPANGAKRYNAEKYRKKRIEEEARLATERNEVAKEVVGLWEYKYQGATYRREFLPDGKANLYINGNRSNAWNGFTWKIQDGALIIVPPNGGSEKVSLTTDGKLDLGSELGTAERVE